jgi:urea transporter
MTIKTAIYGYIGVLIGLSLAMTLTWINADFSLAYHIGATIGYWCAVYVGMTK